VHSDRAAHAAGVAADAAAAQTIRFLERRTRANRAHTRAPIRQPHTPVAGLDTVCAAAADDDNDDDDDNISPTTAAL